VPYSVPATGSYHVGGYVASGAWDYQTSAPLAYLSGDQLGTAGGYTESAAGTTPSFRAMTQSSNLTVTTSSQLADSTISGARAVVEFASAAAPLLNSDLVVEMSCNGGSSWTAAQLLNVTANSQSGRRVAETVDQACTSGSAFAMRVSVLNGKNLSIFGLAITAR
jgi:hypothetical protein